MSAFLQTPPPKAGTPGVAAPEAPAAQGGAGAPPAGGMLTMLLPILILVPFLFLTFRRQKKEQEARKGLKKGDKVVTQSGLIGELIESDERVAKVKIAPGTTVQVLASSLGPFETAAASATEKQLSDLKEAKAGASEKK